MTANVITLIDRGIHFSSISAVLRSPQVLSPIHSMCWLHAPGFPVLLVACPSLPQAGLAYGADASRYGHPQVAAVAVGEQPAIVIQRQGYFLDFLMMVSRGEPNCGLTIKI